MLVRISLASQQQKLITNTMIVIARSMIMSATLLAMVVTVVGVTCSVVLRQAGLVPGIANRGLAGYAS